MNTQSNAMSQPGIGAQPVASSAPSNIRPFYWSLRRELWENRSLYLAPVAVGGVFLFGYMISIVRLPQKMRSLPLLDAAQQRDVISVPYDIAAGALMFTIMVVALFYCLDTLAGERRDRSILFWKSLPVSDLTTVLAKACIPIFILPLIAFAVTFILQWIMLLLSSAVLLASGQSVATYWAQLSLPQVSLLVLYHLITMHGIWDAPFFGWLLLVSAWARRMALLWAVLPVLATIALEKLLFNSSHFAAMLGRRFAGGAEAMTAPGSMPITPMTHLTPGHFLISPGLWLGLLFTAACIAGAAWLRRSRPDAI
jgi:ABC-2 type transport system permease protein